MLAATSTAFSTKFFPEREASARGRRALGSEMIWAAADGNLPAIERLRQQGVPLEVADYDGRTPLHLAAAEGQEEVVRFLIEQGVPREPRDRWDQCPQQEALKAGHFRVAKLLMGQQPEEERAGRGSRRGEVGVFRCIE